MQRAIAALLGITLCACDAGWSQPELAATGDSITIAGAGPTGVTASATVVNQIDVHWTAVGTAFKYYVLESANGGAFQSVASTIAPASAEAVIDLAAGVRYCFEIIAAFPDGSQSEPSAQACAIALGAVTGTLDPVVYITVPSSLFAPPDINVGINAQVHQIPITAGRIVSASIAAQCASSGFIFACARIREQVTWEWCSQPVACAGPASAVVPLLLPITISATAHVDLALMSGPTVATSPFGVYTVQ